MKIVEKVIPTPGNQYKPSVPFAGTVLENKRLTTEGSPDDIRHILLNIGGSGIEYVEGQSIGVVAPGQREDGKNHKVRLYSIASARKGDSGDCTSVSLCVKRVIYTDEQGEEQKGLASNFICDLKVGDSVQLTGPTGRRFLLPTDSNVNLIMVAVGTGIAPFRSFIQHVYHEKGKWDGKIRLFYGAKTGMESLYMNDESNDIGQYFTHETFEAYQALSQGDEKAYVQDRIMGAKTELWEMVRGGNFSFYLCGMKALEHSVKEIFTSWAKADGLDWEEMHKQFKEEGRWNIEVY